MPANEYNQQRPLCPECRKHTVGPATGSTPVSSWNPRGPRTAMDGRNTADRSSGWFLARHCMCTDPTCLKHKNHFSSSDPAFVALLPLEVRSRFPVYLTHQNAVCRELGAELLDNWGEGEDRSVSTPRSPPGAAAPPRLAAPTPHTSTPANA